MKKILYIIMLTTINIIYSYESELEKSTRELIAKLINTEMEIQAIDDVIETLQKENQNILDQIVRLQNDLAKMRVNQGGKGQIKPELKAAADKIIEKIQEKKQKIAHNKSKIQALLLLINPDKKITKKQIPHHTQKPTTVKKTTK